MAFNLRKVTLNYLLKFNVSEENKNHYLYFNERVIDGGC